MLLYSLFHLSGVRAIDRHDRGLTRKAVTLKDIKNFRQLGSKCSGHPEHELTAGVETTTGPLGQGVATAVGMAIAGQWLARYFNRPGFELFNYRVYALCGDGCMMEGIASEAASLAGHLKLSNLCWIYDNNHITNEGNIDLAFSEDVATKFMAFGWNVTRVGDANDLGMLSRAFDLAQQTANRPALIIVDSHIGWGSPHKHDTNSAHAGPLGEEEVRLAKRAWGWPEDKKFYVPREVPGHFRRYSGKRGRELRTEWIGNLERYAIEYPAESRHLKKLLTGELPSEWDRRLPSFGCDAKGIATSAASQLALNAIAQNMPWMIGGSADLGPSVKSTLTFSGTTDFSAATRAGRNLHFGIREHAMGAILNGLALSGLRPFGSGYLVFSDYMRGAIRLSSMMRLTVIYLFGHDSIGLGQDGPTHQPIEHLSSLRSIPNLITLRPGDANEVVEAWRIIMRLKDRPVALILSRQPVPTIDRSIYASAAGAQRGAYVLADSPERRPEVILIATGTEVALCLEAFEVLKRERIGVRVVSMPSWELFEEQIPAYRDSVIFPEISARVSVEAASTFGWSRYVGIKGCSLGIDTFGASAPCSELEKHFGFTVEHVVREAKRQIEINPPILRFPTNGTVDAARIFAWRRRSPRMLTQ
jgi:transketolase